MSHNYSSMISLLLMSSFTLADSVPGTEGPIEITTLLHAGVQLEYQGTVVQVDPWDRLGLPRAKPADLILISDDPGHHLDVGALERLRKPGASVLLTAAGKQKWPDGIVIANGETVRVAGVTVESIAAYDIIQGNPSHPKGDANGYVVTLGGKKFFFAGVTECVAEVPSATARLRRFRQPAGWADSSRIPGPIRGGVGWIGHRIQNWRILSAARLSLAAYN